MQSGPSIIFEVSVNIFLGGRENCFAFVISDQSSYKLGTDGFRSCETLPGWSRVARDQLRPNAALGGSIVVHSKFRVSKRLGTRILSDGCLAVDNMDQMRDLWVRTPKNVNFGLRRKVFEPEKKI